MAEFTLGARASCSDGFCGVVSRTILDPAARTVTHLVIGPRHGEGGRGRRQVAIPVSAVASVGAGIRLNITKEQVEDLPPLGHTG